MASSARPGAPSLRTTNLQLGTQGASDLVGDRHTAARQPQYDDVGRVAILAEQTREDPWSRLPAVAKHALCHVRLLLGHRLPVDRAHPRSAAQSDTARRAPQRPSDPETPNPAALGAPLPLARLGRARPSRRDQRPPLSRAESPFPPVAVWRTVGASATGAHSRVGNGPVTWPVVSVAWTGW